MFWLDFSQQKWHLAEMQNQEDTKSSELIEERINFLSELEEKLDCKIRELSDELEETRTKIRAWKAMEAIAEGVIRPLEGVPQTSKNEQVHKAWAAIQSAFYGCSDELGLRSRDLELRMSSHMPGLKATTFRAYLHRFKNSGLIMKSPNGRWVLVTEQDREGA